MKGLIRFALRKIPRKYLQLFSHILLKIAAIFYKGNGVTCNVCDAEFKKFMPYGRIESRENALCPNCLALERHRLINHYLIKETNFYTAKLKVLHVAPELCFIKRFEKIHGDNYITADIESPLAKVKMDVHSIPFPEASFDVVMCNHVLEHVEDDKKVLKEFYRVLKPGGWAILQSPIDYKRLSTFEDPSIVTKAERELNYGQDDHVRLYGLDYGKRLESAGFILKEEPVKVKFDKSEIKLNGLDKNEIMYFCKK